MTIENNNNFDNLNSAYNYYIRCYFTVNTMISELLLWLVFLTGPGILYYFKGFEPAMILGISITILFQVFAIEEGRDTRKRLIKFIEKICEKYNIENKE